MKPSRILAGFLLLLIATPAFADEVDDAISAAWKSYQANELEAALLALEKVKSEHPEDVRPNARLAFVLLMSDGDLERIFDLLLEHLGQYPDDEWGRKHVFIVADRALSAGRPALARDCARALMEMDPANREYRYLWARASYRLGRRDSVAQACRSLIDDYRSWQLPYWLLARTLADQGEYEKVVEIYRGLLKEQPGNVGARLRMARAQLMQRDYDAAEQSYRSALEIADPGSADREDAEAGIEFVKSERELTHRLQEQGSFLDMMLVVVACGWAVVILVLIVATRSRRS